MPDPDQQSTTPTTPTAPPETQPAPVETPIPVVTLNPGYLDRGTSHDDIETR